MHTAAKYEHSFSLRVRTKISGKCAFLQGFATLIWFCKRTAFGVQYFFSGVKHSSVLGGCFMGPRAAEDEYMCMVLRVGRPVAIYIGARVGANRFSGYTTLGIEHVCVRGTRGQRDDVPSRIGCVRRLEI